MSLMSFHIKEILNLWENFVTSQIKAKSKSFLQLIVYFFTFTCLLIFLALRFCFLGVIFGNMIVILCINFIQEQLSYYSHLHGNDTIGLQRIYSIICNRHISCTSKKRSPCRGYIAQVIQKLMSICFIASSVISFNLKSTKVNMRVLSYFVIFMYDYKTTMQVCMLRPG